MYIFSHWKWCFILSLLEFQFVFSFHTLMAEMNKKMLILDSAGCSYWWWLDCLWPGWQ